MRLAKILPALAMIALLPATAAAQTAPHIGRPQNVPLSADSAFEPALACMDELLSRSSVGSGYLLVPAGIADPTNKGGYTQDMIIGAATKMSRRSHFFDIVLDPARMGNGVKFFQTGGSLTAFDQQVESKDKGAGISIGQAIGANATNRTGLSNLTVSLYLLDANSKVLDGTYSSSSLVLENKGKSRLLSGALSFLGGSLSMNSSSSDGPQAGVKALIDLGMIQAVGSLAQVPYANCLAGIGAPTTTNALWDEFRRMKPAQQRAAISAEMVRRGLAPADPSTVQLEQAIATFERSQGMTPSGKVRFELYEALKRVAKTAAPMNRPALGVPAVKVTGSPGPFRYSNGMLPVVSKGDKLGFQVTVAEPAYVACFYTDSTRNVTRVFPSPNRPAYRLNPGEILRMPGEQDSYIIRAENPGTEWFTCFAGQEGFLQRIAGVIPDSAFDPLSKITSATQLVVAATSADPTLSTDTLSFSVEEVK